MTAGSMAGQMKGRGWSRLALIALGLLALLALGYGAYGRFFAAPGQTAPAPVVASPASVAVKTARVASAPLSSALSYSGDIRPVSQVSVLPKASGRIEALRVDVGSHVARGQLIATLESAGLAAQVSQARAALQSAQARLSALEEGARPEHLAQALAALESAQARRDQLVQGPREAQLVAASSAVDQASSSASSARANLAAAQAGLDALRAWPTSSEWARAFAGVDTARANLRAAEERAADVSAGAKPAELLAATQQVEAARAALMAKEDGLQVAKDNGTALSSWAATGTSLGQSQESLVAARTAYEAARANLALLQSRPLAWEMQAAASNVEAARASLSAASALVDQMKRGAMPEDIARAQAAYEGAQGALAASEAGLRSAEAAQKDLLAGADAEDLKVAEAAVVQAEEAYKLASKPYRPSDYELARAGVAQARAALEAAELALAEATITSPLEGIVAERPVSEGQLVGPSAPLVTLISSQVELVLGVEEAMVGKVAVGQRAEVAVAAYPKELFEAKVVQISPTADAKSRTFSVKVRPQDEEGKLKGGMFATVRIITSAKESALVVPREAVVTRAGQESVFVVSGETASLRAIRTGLVSSNQVEILEGLGLGDEVVVAGSAELRDGDRIKR